MVNVTVCAAVEVSRVPSGMPRDPRSRVTSRVVIRDHRSQIRRNKTHQTCISPLEPRFPGSADQQHLLVSLHLLCFDQFVTVSIGESAPPVLLRSFSFNTPLLNVIKTHSPLYSMAGDRFRRPVNLLWFLVFELPPNRPCSPHRCSHPALFFHNNRPWTLVARAWRPKVHNIS